MCYCKLANSQLQKLINNYKKNSESVWSHQISYETRTKNSSLNSVLEIEQHL